MYIGVLSACPLLGGLSSFGVSLTVHVDVIMVKGVCKVYVLLHEILYMRDITFVVFTAIVVMFCMACKTSYLHEWPFLGWNCSVKLAL